MELGTATFALIYELTEVAWNRMCTYYSSGIELLQIFIKRGIIQSGL